MKITVIGGTGPQGKGLAQRFALAGVDVVVGSRDKARAEGIAAELAEDIRQRGDDIKLSDDHVSHRHMLANSDSGDDIIVYGDGAAEWLASNGQAEIEGIADNENALRDAKADIVMLCHSGYDEREQLVDRLLKLLPTRKIILFPEEMDGIINPSGAF